MRCFCVLLLAAVSQAAVLNKSVETEPLAAPVLKQLIAVDPLGFKIVWEPVKSDSLVGYKVIMWEQPIEKVYKYKIIDGVRVLVEELVPAKFPLSTNPPSFDPKEAIVTKADDVTAQVTNQKVGLIYEFRVQALDKDGEGPLSSPMRLKYLETKPAEHEKDVYVVA